MMPISVYNGLLIYENPYMLDEKEIKRSLLERVFSLHPFQKYKKIKVPSMQFIVTADGKLFGHPQLIKELTKAIDRKKSEAGE